MFAVAVFIGNGFYVYVLEVRGSAGPSGPGRRARVDPRPISPYGTTVSGDHGRSDGAAVGFREG